MYFMEGAAYMIGTDYTAAQAERYTGSPSGKMKKTDCVFMEKIAEQAAAGRDTPCIRIRRRRKQSG